MPTFKFKGDSGISLFSPAGLFNSMPVEPGAVVEAPGHLVKTEGDGALEDAYVVDNGGDVRAWSKALWELQTGKSADSAANKEK